MVRSRVLYKKKRSELSPSNQLFEFAKADADTITDRPLELNR